MLNPKLMKHICSLLKQKPSYQKFCFSMIQIEYLYIFKLFLKHLKESWYLEFLIRINKKRLENTKLTNFPA